MNVIPQNAVTKLRIMTKKSRLNFGRYDGMTIGDIMATSPKYIAFVYYNISPISFCDEILDELVIPRIDKPGTNKDMYFEYLNKLRDCYTEEEQEHYRFKKYWAGKRAARARKARVDKEYYYNSKKSRMQTKNQEK